jgi:hypothetical protein
MRVFFAEFIVSGPLIGAEQADFVGDGFSHKGVKRGPARSRLPARPHCLCD